MLTLPTIHLLRLRLWAVLTSSVLFSLGSTQGGGNPAIEALNDAIIFHLGFDEEIVDADLAAGDATPRRVNGSVSFAPGIFGHALILGGEDGPVLQYATSENINFAAAGAFSFWMAPLEWTQRADADRRETLRFFSLPGARGGGLFIQRQGFRYVTQEDGALSRRHDRFQVGLYSLPDWDNVIHSSGFSAEWKALEWRLIVVNWDRSGYSVSMDGGVPEYREFSRFLDVEDFPENANSGRSSIFTLGYQDEEERTLLDEFTVYRRQLTETEIRELYENSVVAE